VNVFSYLGGVALLYINKTSQIYKETLTLNLVNLKGVNCDPSKPIPFSVNPHSNYLINLKTIDLNEAT